MASAHSIAQFWRNLIGKGQSVSDQISENLPDLHLIFLEIEAGSFDTYGVERRMALLS